MAIKFAHGFKARSERVACEVRAEHGLRNLDPIDCLAICESLLIPVVPIDNLVDFGAAESSIRCLLSQRSGFSAVTVCHGTAKVIAYNPSHPPGRQASSLAHELSHILLEHPVAPALGAGGCRNWDPRLEAEADWQAGALLVPREAALHWMQNDGCIDRGARRYGVSVAMFRWRVQQTGVAKQLSLS
ncbi:MAG: ImmA/IrrE family metallo-endopeptidase [Chthonomonadales bacterium]